MNFGSGFSDSTNTVNVRRFIRGLGDPVVGPKGLGYRQLPGLSVASRLRKGIFPTVGHAAPSGSREPYRFTLHHLDRYVFGNPGRAFANPDESVVPYVVFGDLGQGEPSYLDDDRIPTTLRGLNAGAGPSIGGGVDIPLDGSFSMLIESRFDLTSSNAIYASGSMPLGMVDQTGVPSGSGTGLLTPTQSTSSGMNVNSASTDFSYSMAALGLATILLGAVPSAAQSMDVDTPFFAKLGVGLSDYTGDFPIQNRGHPLDMQEFKRGSGFPFTTSNELGYRLSPSYAVALGLQVGNYPVAGYRGSNVKDTNFYTVQLLGRYTFSNLSESIKPYVDGGLNVTLSGIETGYGPSVGGGVEVPLNRSVSFFVESRFNFTAPDDAVDGQKNIGDSPPTDKTSNPKGSVTGPLDSFNQLLGVGLKVSFGGDSDDEPSDETDSSRNSPDPAEKTPSLNAKNPHPDTSRYKQAIKVPSGTYILGLAAEDPLSLQNAGRKRVTVSSFYIDQYEVTNAEYREYLSQLSPEERREKMPDSTVWEEARMQENWEAYFKSDYYSDYPVLAVTWNEAQAYCKAQDKRLPTEAEWEYAARGGHIGRVYPWEGMSTRNEEGDYLANFNPPEGYTADGYAFTAPVDAFPPNDWGLYNVAGNVAEWTLDAYTPSYDNISDFNPRYRDEDESRRVVRGGAWNSDSFSIGVGVRDAQPRDTASVSVGFRCVRDVGVLDQEKNSDSSSGTQTGGQE
jgi:formylglycine-generating enzyme required for sulfatase activity